MKLVSSLVGGIGLAAVVSLMTLGGCGGDKSVVTATGGATASTGGSDNGGDTSIGGNTSAGGESATGGTTSTGTTNPYLWSFYQDAEGYGTGIYPDDGTMTGELTNVQAQTYCDGGCADILVTFNGEDDQNVNFMKYWSDAVDLSGKTLTARIKIVDETGVISAVDLHAQNGSDNSYKWSATASVTSSSTPSLETVISSETSVTISISLGTKTDTEGAFDPTIVQGIGINISGTAGASGTAHVYVDHIELTD